MRYDIQTQYNMSSGALLTVRFPESELDQKALYTIQIDQPEFLVPFRYRSIDGCAECIYQLDGLSKLQYRCGKRSPKEYIAFWTQVLQPLLDCGDWFCKPLSFVLEADYLYIDKAGKNICYLYIPSIPDCVEQSAVKAMAVELSQKNTTTDQQLENQVLRMVMQDFQPKAFLQTLCENPSNGRDIAPAQSVPQPAAGLYPPMPDRPPVPPPSVLPQPMSPPSAAVDDMIKIDLGGAAGKSEREEAKRERSGGLFGAKKPKEPKPVKEKVKRKGLFGARESESSKEVVLGASPSADAVGQPAPAWTPPPIHVQESEENELTELAPEAAAGNRCLRLISAAPLPKIIPVTFQGGAPFTIGRFDVSVGIQQSSFEFDKRTKAVSRHHAAIERQPDGVCQITDLSSSAGTFVNGIRLTPNVPCPLTSGSRVSFGTCGADYVWEG